LQLAFEETIPMPEPAAQRPRKRPVQARSQATVDAILEAAARILVAEGYGGFTTNRVAAAAGVSVGSLYQYFPNKEALLAELKGRHVAQLERGLDTVMAGLGDAPLAEIVTAVIAANVAAHLIDPELHRVLSTEVPQLGPTDASIAFDQRTAARVRAVFASHRREIAVHDLDLAAYLVVRTVEATIHEAVVERPDDLASGAIAREVTRLLLNYLTVGTAPHRRAPSRDPSASREKPRGRRARRR
jgi:AcrR family transcriptional regulator